MLTAQIMLQVNILGRVLVYSLLFYQNRPVIHFWATTNQLRTAGLNQHEYKPKNKIIFNI